MTKKTITITTLCAALVLAMAVWATAGPGYGRGYGGCGGPGWGANSGYSQLSPEKQAEADKVFEKYSAKFNELRNEMWAKHSTLQAMINGGDANEKKIAELTADITQAKEAMWQVRQEMSNELVKVTGITSQGGYGGCPGYGQSDCPGYGGGRGRGWQGGQQY